MIRKKHNSFPIAVSAIAGNNGGKKKVHGAYLDYGRSRSSLDGGRRRRSRNVKKKHHETRRRSRRMAAMAWEAKREVHLGGPRRFTTTITTRMKKTLKMQKNEEAQRFEEEEACGAGEREARVIFF